VHSPSVNGHRLELARDSGLEDAVVHRRRDADSIVEQRHCATPPFSARREEDAPGVGVSGVAKQFDDNVLSAADVMLRLATLGFRDAQPNVSITECLLDLEVCVAGDCGYEVEEIVA